MFVAFFYDFENNVYIIIRMGRLKSEGVSDFSKDTETPALCLSRSILHATNQEART